MIKVAFQFKPGNFQEIYVVNRQKLAGERNLFLGNWKNWHPNWHMAGIGPVAKKY
jgi:hypothetical protein